ncbi:hypothetical protein LSH36_100g09006 [Paralvinella palmiformis]|uniref:Uncharacterized protein n=1 Tax=Paralvinella palmiformis TaxID=53620 RepID=A0AAD9JZX9_9ANNE|nr:hypothetical protein LSH36_100g09006 [Paralvinella palmiformis]
MMFMPVTKSGSSSKAEKERQLKRRASIAGTCGKRDSIFDSYNCVPLPDSDAVTGYPFLEGDRSKPQKQGRKQSLDADGQRNAPSAARRATTAGDDLRRDLTLDGVSLDNSLDGYTGGGSGSAGSKKLRDVVRKKIIPANIFKSAIARKTLPKTIEEDGRGERLEEPRPAATPDAGSSTGGGKLTPTAHQAEAKPNKDDAGGGTVSSQTSTSARTTSEARLSRRESSQRMDQASGGAAAAGGGGGGGGGTNQDGLSSSHANDRGTSAGGEPAKPRPKLHRAKSSIDASCLPPAADPTSGKKSAKRWRQAVIKVKTQRSRAAHPNDGAASSAKTAGDDSGSRDDAKRAETCSEKSATKEKSTRSKRHSKHEPFAKPDDAQKMATNADKAESRPDAQQLIGESLEEKRLSVMSQPAEETTGDGDKMQPAECDQKETDEHGRYCDMSTDVTSGHNEERHQGKDGDECRQRPSGQDHVQLSDVHQSSSKQSAEHSAAPSPRQSLGGMQRHRVVCMGVPQSLSHPEMTSRKHTTQCAKMPASMSHPKMSQAADSPQPLGRQIAEPVAGAAAVSCGQVPAAFGSAQVAAGRQASPSQKHRRVPPAAAVLEPRAQCSLPQPIYQNITYNQPEMTHSTSYSTSSRTAASQQAAPAAHYAVKNGDVNPSCPAVVYPGGYYYGQQYSALPTHYLYQEVTPVSRDASNNIKNELSKYIMTQPTGIQMVPYYVNIPQYMPYMYMSGETPQQGYGGVGLVAPPAATKQAAAESHTYVNISNFHSQMPPNELANFLKCTVQKREPGTRHRKIIPKGGKCTCKHKHKKLEKQATAPEPKSGKSLMKNEKNHAKSLVRSLVLLASWCYRRMAVSNPLAST